MRCFDSVFHKMRFASHRLQPLEPTMLSRTTRGLAAASGLVDASQFRRLSSSFGLVPRDASGRMRPKTFDVALIFQ
jgi:hypothetical protein